MRTIQRIRAGFAVLAVSGVLAGAALAQDMPDAKDYPAAAGLGGCGKSAKPTADSASHAAMLAITAA